MRTSSASFSAPGMDELADLGKRPSHPELQLWRLAETEGLHGIRSVAIRSVALFSALHFICRKKLESQNDKNPSS